MYDGYRFLYDIYDSHVVFSSPQEQEGRLVMTVYFETANIAIERIERRDKEMCLLYDTPREIVAGTCSVQHLFLSRSLHLIISLFNCYLFQ